MRQRQFFRIILRNLEYVELFCNDSNDPSHFACPRWIFNNQSN